MLTGCAGTISKILGTDATNELTSFWTRIVPSQAQNTADTQDFGNDLELPAAPQPEDRGYGFTAGQASGLVYTNSFFGFSYTAEESMSFYTEAQLRRINNMPQSAADFDAELLASMGSGRSYVLAEAGDRDSLYMFDVVITDGCAGMEEAEAAETVQNGDALIEMLREQSYDHLDNYFRTSDFSNIQIEKTTVNVLNEDRPCIRVHADLYDTQLHECTVYFVRNGYVAQLTVLNYGDDLTDHMLAKVGAAQ